ncbi:MAG: MBL fold metallo-hydrolase [Candidatus Micrarchaeia archaeon]|jgi:competence protein ComEC
MKKIIVLIFLIGILLFGCISNGEEKPHAEIPDKNQTTKPNETIYQPPKPVYEDVLNGTIRFNEDIEADLEVYFIDVGMGDATLLKKGDFEILIDAGGEKDIINFLNEKNITNLEIAITTKYTKDNSAQMKKILENFKVQQYWDNGIKEENIYYNEIYTILENKNIPIKNPEFGENVNLNGISITILNPQKIRYPNVNPTLNSITLYITDRNFSLYFSDVETGVQNTILANYPNIKSTFMKAPNHGTSTASVGGDQTVQLFSLIDKVKPEYAVVFVGPTEEEIPNNAVLEAFRLRKAKMLRTDLNGTISVITDGYEYNITTSIEQKKK